MGFGQTNASEDFLKKFPLGKVPAFEDSTGVCLSESNAIAYYVSNDTLRGTNPVDQALILQYLEFADNEVLPCMYMGLSHSWLQAVQQTGHRESTDSFEKMFDS